MQIRRHGGHDARQGGLDVAHDIQRRSGAGLHDRQQRAAHAVLAHGILLRREAVVNLRHVAQINRRAIHNLDWQAVQVINQARIGIHGNIVFGSANFRRAAGQNYILRVDGVDDILGDQIFRLQRGQAQIHRDDAGFAAVRPGNHCAARAGQPDANLVGGHVKKLLLRHFRTAETVLQNRHRGGVVLDDQRRLHSGRH